MNRFTRPLRALLAGAVLSALLVSSAAAAGIGQGTVNTDALRLRKGVGTNTAILTLLYRGETVTVLEDAGNGWYKVQSGSTVGYVSGDYLILTLATPEPTAEPTPEPTPEPTAEPTPEPTAEPTPEPTAGPTPEPTVGPTAEPTAAPADDPAGDPVDVPEPPVEEEVHIFGRVNTGGSALNVRSGPGVNHSKIAALADGTVVEITEELNGWYAITTYGGTLGYVSAEYLEPAERPEMWDIPETDLRAQVVAYAKSLLGKKYVYGAEGPSSFDCSGFTYYVYGHFGYALNRGGSAQLKNGVAVERSDLQPGDLVFFHDGKNLNYPMSHVGIYIGDNQFIHASTNGYKVIISNLSGIYSQRYVYARRILETV